MDTLTRFVFPAALYIVPVVLFWGILRQSGHRGPWAILALIPGVNVLIVCVLACREWPATKELARRRLADNEAAEEDELSVLYQAAELETRGELQPAADLCQLLMTNGTSTRDEATQLLERIRGREDGPEWTGGCPERH